MADPKDRPTIKIDPVPIVWTGPKTGRPKIELKDLPDDWPQIILDQKSRGASDVEVRVCLGISADTWDRLIKEEEEFSLTVEKGKELCEAWWLATGRVNLGTFGFNYTGWMMNMSNRFGWHLGRNRQDDDDERKQLPPAPAIIQVLPPKLEEDEQ